MRVVMLAEPTTGDLSVLRAGLDPAIELDFDLSAGARVDVLVAGRPSAEQLARCRRALVIPYAGLPTETRRLLLERPPLPVYNLHHNAAAVAEVAVALLLAAAKVLLPMDRALRALDWRPRYAPDPGLPLGGERAVILGYGAVGRRVGRLLSGLGMEVVGLGRAHAGSLLGALSGARALVVCAPLTPETEGLVGPAELAALGAQGVLVNVGRAQVVDEEALFEALAAGVIHSAGLDPWYRYPASEDERLGTPPSAFPLATLDRVVLSPHRAGHGPHVERARHEALAVTLSALARGEAPPGRVDVEAGY